MAGSQRKHAVITDLRGRDGSTQSQIQIAANKAKECKNVDFDKAAFARKRGGATAVTITSANLTGKVSAAYRHVPGADETAAELWLVDDAATPVLARNAANSWSNPTWKSNIATRPQDVQFISFNGKNYILGDSGVDRMQVFDPAISTSALQYAGHATPGAPSVANTGSGSYAATIRYYRVIFTTQISSVTVKRSLASAVQSFTPSGSGTAARVTKPSSISEGETHWELYGATAEAGPYYLLATTAVGTTTYDDSTVPAGYYQNVTLMPTQGDNTALHSAKYGLTDDNRLLLAGAWETGHSQNEVWFTPVLGSTSAAFYDDERLPTDNKVAFNERDSGYITGLGGPLESNVLVYKNRQTWRMIPTGIESDPYRRKLISKDVGCVHQKTVVSAEDDTGTPTLYWLSHLGPYRYNLKTGLARLTWDVEDVWDTVNLSATTIVAHGLYHPNRHQIWWWVSVNSENEPTTTKIVYDTRRGRVLEAGQVKDGWSVHDGESAKARCSVMFSNTLGATMSRDLKPYIGQHGGNARLWKCDTSDTSDNGTAFRGYVEMPHRHFGGLEQRCQLGNTLLLGSAGSYTLAVTMSRNYGEETRTATVSMAAGGSETRVLKAVEGIETADAEAVALTVGDESAVASSWTLDAVIQPYEARELVVA